MSIARVFFDCCGAEYTLASARPNDDIARLEIAAEATHCDEHPDCLDREIKEVLDG